MKIALLGYGKMGKMVEQSAIEKGHKIVGTFSSKFKQGSLEEADIIIDFSHPETVINNIKLCGSLGKSLVMGTTGWYEEIEMVKETVLKHEIGFLYAANFSIGVNIFMQLVSHAAKLFKDFSEYDIGAFESHHNQKFDKPSGTAKVLEKIIENNSGKQVEFCSLRCGFDPGTHRLIFDSLSDTITLTHQSRNRKSFADGSILAAEWLQQRKGFFTIEDMLNNGGWSHE